MLEHVDEKYMANYMEAFKQARYAIVTHGDLGQGGFNHVNNQHAQYWIEKFKEYEISGHVTIVKGERSKIATLASKIL